MSGSRRTQEQWESLVSGWQRSGLSRRAYCDRHGVSSGSLRRWEDFFAQRNVNALTPPPELPVQATFADSGSPVPISDEFTELADLAEKAQELSRQLELVTKRAGIALSFSQSAARSASQAFEGDLAETIPFGEPMIAPVIQPQTTAADTAKRVETPLTDSDGIPPEQPPQLDALPADVPPPETLKQSVETRALSAPAQAPRSSSGTSTHPVVVSPASRKDTRATPAQPSRRAEAKAKGTRSAAAAIKVDPTAVRLHTITPDSAAAPASKPANMPVGVQVTAPAPVAPNAAESSIDPEASLTREQWRALAGGWLLSGMSQGDYCAKHGISVESLRHWREVFEQERKAVPRAKKPKPSLSGATDTASVPVPASQPPEPAMPIAVAPRRPDPAPAGVKGDAHKTALPPAASITAHEPLTKDTTELSKPPKVLPKSPKKAKHSQTLDPAPLNGSSTAVLEPVQPIAVNGKTAHSATVVASASTPSVRAKSGDIRVRATIPNADALSQPNAKPKPEPVGAPAKAVKADKAAELVEPLLTREQWRALAGGWLLSGLSQSDYCAHHGISIENLRHWREVFAQERAAKPKPAKTASKDRLETPPEPADQGSPVAVQSALPYATAAGVNDLVSMALEAPVPERISTAASPAPVPTTPLNDALTIQAEAAEEVSVYLDESSPASASVLESTLASANITDEPSIEPLPGTPPMRVDPQPLRVQPESVTEMQRTRDQWRAVAANWMLSGLTQRDYCERNGISLDSFQHWWELFARESSAPETPAQRIREKARSLTGTIGPLGELAGQSLPPPVEVTRLDRSPAAPVTSPETSPSTSPSAPAESPRQVTLHLTPEEAIAPIDHVSFPWEQSDAVEAVASQTMAAGSRWGRWRGEDSEEAAKQAQRSDHGPWSLGTSVTSASVVDLPGASDWAESAPATPPTSDPVESDPVDPGPMRSPDRATAGAPEPALDNPEKPDVGRKLHQWLAAVKGWLRRVASGTVERVAAVNVPRKPVKPELQSPAQAYQSGSASASAEGSPVYTHTRRITLDPEYLRDHRVITDFGFGEAAQSYKILRTQVLQRARSNGWRTLGVTATRQGHGKTLTALNLAISLANEVNQTVLLADLDLRRPSLSGYLCAEKLNGISDYLIGRYDISEILINPGIKRLVILPGNEPLINSSEQLSSPRMVQLVEELKMRYPDRIVLFDLPPLLMGDDVMAFAPNLDALILVLEEGKTTREELRRAYELLEGQNILGTVLNKSVYNLGAPGYGGESY